MDLLHTQIMLQNIFTLQDFIYNFSFKTFFTFDFKIIGHVLVFTSQERYIQLDFELKNVTRLNI